MAKEDWHRDQKDDKQGLGGSQMGDKKRKIFQTDGNSSRGMENLLEGWTAPQSDGNGSREMEICAPGGEVKGGFLSRGGAPCVP